MKRLIFVLFMGWSLTFAPTLRAQKSKMEGQTPVYNFGIDQNASEDFDLDFDVGVLEKSGRSYALVIANSDYDDPTIKDLAQPIKDASRLVDALQTYYTFDMSNMTYLKNAKQSQILEALDGLAKKLTTLDNLLIFYAGHGDWDESLGIGYWLPADAEKKNKSSWFPNSTLRDYIKAIQTKHTLLIADACFSGGIFNTRALLHDDASRAIQEMYSQASRQAMTSGNLKEVPDQSVFIDFLVKKLRSNKSKYLSAGSLFFGIKELVIDNSANGQIPQFGVISGTGHGGGDFIFIRKN